jgi:D-3-phosphoglycerate dehydrogenase
MRMVGGVFDNAGLRLPLDALFARNVAVIDATRGWAQSVAEVALCLALCALRRVAWWHRRMADGEPLWEYEAGQFCDAGAFVNGDLGTKRVGVVGLGQIGRRVAQGCIALGATVNGFDPFLPGETIQSWGVMPVDLDTLIDRAEVVFITVPPTPSARGMVNRERILRLRQGALVVIVTRAAAVDMGALRERILADELAGAFDVYDVEPLPVDDPLRGRMNVVHTPHVAGRTRDANLRVADIIADDFARILRGELPQARLTREAIAARTGHIQP